MQFQHSLVSLFWGHGASGPVPSSFVLFQHSLVSLFWGHQKAEAYPRNTRDVSALSGESILGPRYSTSGAAGNGDSVSALSGESILGPQKIKSNGMPACSCFSTLW